MLCRLGLEFCIILYIELSNHDGLEVTFILFECKIFKTKKFLDFSLVILLYVIYQFYIMHTLTFLGELQININNN